MLEWSLACMQGACVSCRILHNPIHPSAHSELVHCRCHKETTSCTRCYVQDGHWMRNVSNSYPCDLIISLCWFLSGDIFLIQDFLPDEVVTATSGLTSTGCHLTVLPTPYYSEVLCLLLWVRTLGILSQVRRMLILQRWLLVPHRKVAWISLLVFLGGLQGSTWRCRGSSR